MTATRLLQQRISRKAGGQQSKPNAVLAEGAVALLDAGLPIALLGLALAVSSGPLAEALPFEFETSIPNAIQEIWGNILVRYVRATSMRLANSGFSPSYLSESRLPSDRAAHSLGEGTEAPTVPPIII
jgi:hypothetical protein